MSYGIAAYGTDGKITFHSDYSSVVYVGEVAKNTTPTQPVYTGSHHIAISSSLKESNYNMGWLVQYTITLDVDFMVPFYKPAFDGQEIAITDVINEGTTWVVNVIFSGGPSQYPYIYAFAPLTELPSSDVTLNSHGIAVYDANSNLVFTDSRRALRVDEVVTISHGSSIRTGSKGVCGNSNTCHVNFTPDASTTHTGAVNNTITKMYHIVPSAYGGLAYQNSGSGTFNCGFLGSGNRPYAWAYKSWSSFRGTVKHPRGGATHVAGWEADFGGAAHQFVQGSCGYGGFLGALLGAFLVVFSGGAALAVIGGALAGFSIAGFLGSTTPSIKAYDADQTFDTSNNTNLIITDTSYYALTAYGDIGASGSGRLTFNYNRAANSKTYWYTVEGVGAAVEIDGLYISPNAAQPALSFNATSATSNSVTYYRGDLQSTEVISGSTHRFYKVAKI